MGLAAAGLAALTVGAAAQDLRIGVPASLSGRFVAFGAQVQRGVEGAIETWKAVRGSDTVAGHKIVVIPGDTQSNTSLTVSVMNKLIQSDKVNVMVGPGASDIGAAAVPPWKKSPDRPIWLVPGVSTTVAEKEVGKDPYYFHTFTWTYDYHSTNVAALKAALGSNKKVAIVYSDGAYGRAHIESARKYLKQAGFTIVDEELIREGGNDFTPALFKVRAKKPDILYTLVQTSDGVLLTKQVRSLNLPIPYLVGTFQAVLPEWKKAVGPLQECWTGVTTYMPGANYPADPKEPKLFPSGNDWEAAWRARFHKEPEYMEAGAYVSTILALLAVEKAQSLDRDKIEKVMADANYNTVLGPSKFEPSEIGVHQAFSKMVMFQQQKVGNDFKSVILYPPAVAQGKLQKCPTQ
jgi:ABC-type branched-subunit amino acid transport system substrate-binding protein